MKHLHFCLIIIFALSIGANGQQFQKAPPDVLNQKLINIQPVSNDELSNRIDPFFKNTIRNVLFLKEQNELSSERLADINRMIKINEDVLAEISAPAFIKTKDVQITESKIISLGGIIYTVINDILTAELPLSIVYQLAIESETIYIAGSLIDKPQIDISRVESKVKQLHDGSGIPRPYKGKDVVVGVLDSGIDWQHADFKNASGNRIRFLWDMFGQGNPPAGYNYGTEYTKAQLDANQCNETDVNGHGTHVAGTAAGNGGANSLYIGMAPEADLVIVKAAHTGGFSQVDVTNGSNYVFQKAQQLSKPAVLNLSLGGNFGPHDGTSLYEQTLSNLTGPGKIIVAAAGNSGDETIHLSYAVSGSSYNDSFETFWNMPDNAPVALIDMWYNTGSISVGIAAYDKTTVQLIGFTGPVGPGQKVEDIPFTVGGTTYGWFTIDATNTNDPNNGAKEVFFALDSHNGQVNLANVFWSIYTFGSGTFDAWSIGSEFDPYTAQWFKGGDSHKTIGIPATSNKLVCIGSYVTKNSWVDINGTTQYQPGNPVIGAISSFSSLGPTRDNRVKPDLVAPGEVIIAALSSNSSPPPAWVLLGGKLRKMQGTSMAAPHVAGVIALLLEKNSSLNYDQAVNILKTTAVRDNYTGNSANNTYGHGKMHAYNAFINLPTSVEGTDDLNIPVEFALYQNYPNPFNPETRIKFDLPQQSQVTIKIYDVLGKEVAEIINEELPAGQFETSFNADGLASGIYLYQLQAGSFIHAKKLIVLR